MKRFFVYLKLFIKKKQKGESFCLTAWCLSIATVVLIISVAAIIGIVPIVSTIIGCIIISPR